MQVLVYSDLNIRKITGFSKFKKAMEAGNFAQADVKKIASNIYRAKLSQAARLLFSLYRYQQQTFCLVLEYLPNHEYEKSRFLNGSPIDENKIPAVKGEPVESEPCVYINHTQPTFYYLDKVISFDEVQQQIYDTPVPVVIVGSAGSGKTALTLEKMKQMVGDVLYVSHSTYLVQNARNLYYSNGYQNDHQEEVDFLSFREYLESIHVPEGREVTRRDFERWYIRHTHKQLPVHKLFEEFRGVLTGPSVKQPWLEREQYLQLGVKQSLFVQELRPSVYDLFEKYLQFLQQSNLFDSNIISQQYLQNVQPRYNFVVVDEVQDLTNTQLMLILKSLHQANEFMLCGDANQIVHPNFFSWSKLKSLFFDNQQEMGEQALNILQANYRNSPLVTNVANRILKLKHARFGSVDRESNYLVKSVGDRDGKLQLLQDGEKVRQQLDDSIARSTKFAVIVMHPEQKPEAERIFSTPLVFSIQEAKGLEYENIILFNFVHQEQQIFKEIASGVSLGDLDVSELKYARAKNKTDKSLEAYKFYINALYVAVTRAVSSLYIVESSLQHALLNLLDLQRFTGELDLAKQESTFEEWQKEAHKLELQGKQEQAENIRKHILKQQPVPWKPLQGDEMQRLLEAAKDNNKKAKLQLMEYSLLHQGLGYLSQLEQDGFKAVSSMLNKNNGTQKAINTVYKNHFMLYTVKQHQGVLREIDKYGVDHRNRFNMTPLMTAAYAGNHELVETIIERGAETSLIANHGLNAWQMIFARILLEPSGRYAVAKLYRMLAPGALSIQVDERLEKLDDHTMFGFLLNAFISLWYQRATPHFIICGEGITAADLHELFVSLPDSVLPPMKKKRNYISRYLSENEVDRDQPRNRKLFKRVKRGHYMLNPALKIRQGESWYSISELFDFDSIGCFGYLTAKQQKVYKRTLDKNLAALRSLYQCSLDDGLNKRQKSDVSIRTFGE
tara:strand:+ start:492 stop:3359 length:2868 start_codon:yes stop_codon:yes gene_type:complete